MLLNSGGIGRQRKAELGEFQDSQTYIVRLRFKEKFALIVNWVI